MAGLGADGFDGTGSGKRPQFQDITRERDRFVASELEKLKGLPWNLNGSLGG